MADASVIDLTSSPPAATPPSSSHRLPTVSATQALQDLHNSRSKCVSSGLPSLDAILGGGFERGRVTEIWGPSGAGKTALLLHAAGSAFSGEGSVMWMNTNKALHPSRAKSLAPQSTSNGSHPQQSRFLDLPSLSHLLAFILHPLPDALPPSCALLVIDGLDGLLELDYPRYQSMTPNQTEQKKWQAGRRYATLAALITALNKLAVLNNLAVAVTTGCATRSRYDNGLGAALVPGVGASEWDAGIWNRLVVFRDHQSRFVGVQKCQGKHLVPRDEAGGVGRVVSFWMTADGAIREHDGNARLWREIVHSPQKPASKPALKRSFDEVADSEDEDVDEYGWVDSDEHALNLDTLVEPTQPVENEAIPD